MAEIHWPSRQQITDLKLPAVDRIFTITEGRGITGAIRDGQTLQAVSLNSLAETIGCSDSYIVWQDGDMIPGGLIHFCRMGFCVGESILEKDPPPAPESEVIVVFLYL